MKKLFLTLSLILGIGLSASAQLFTIRLEAAPAFSFASLAKGLNITKNGTKVGYHFGAYLDVPVYKGLYLGSGLTFTMKGSRFNSSMTEQTVNSVTDGIADLFGLQDKNAVVERNTTLHYLQIPINIGYQLNLFGIKLGIQTGPYFALALGGTTKIGVAGAYKSFNIFKEGIKDNIKNFSPKRFDMGWGAQAMAYFMNYYATVGADFGFLNVGKNKTNAEKIASTINGFNFKNSTQIFIGVGYCF